MQATRILLFVFAFRRHNNLHDPVTNSLSCIQDDTLKVSSAGYRPSERLLSDSVYCVVHRCYSCFCLLLPYLLRSCLRVGGG